MRRIVIVLGLMLCCGLLLLARLIQLQLIDGSTYHDAAQEQHNFAVKLPAQRGEVLALNSKTNETSILATNTTLDLVYVDPKVVDQPALIAETLADLTITDDVHKVCSTGDNTCPRELISFANSPYAPLYDPLGLVKQISSGSLLEPLPAVLPSGTQNVSVPGIAEVRRLFAADIERRISEKRVVFAPVKYSVTNREIALVEKEHIPGVSINKEQRLIYANPEEVNQSSVGSIGRRLAGELNIDATKLVKALTSRPLRYVPIMRRIAPQVSLKIKEKKLDSLVATNALRTKAKTHEEADKLQDPLRSIALIPEHWRFYPDDTIASQVVGFLNNNQEAQYGIERTFDSQMRGQEGLISTVSDLQRGQILTSNQKIIDPKDGDSIVLTIDPFIQKEAERIMQKAVDDFQAESGQAIVMDPFTGRILAMVNAPLFQRNSYASVYDKVPITIPDGKEQNIAVEIYNPTTNVLIVKAYLNQVFTDDGRSKLPEKVQQQLSLLQADYDLHEIARYYLYVGENTRLEVFPTTMKNVWLRFKNIIGVGAYLNRSVQEIYEPGSVMKPITMSIALDQGEVTPQTIYDDKEEVKVDEYTIKNALLAHYGKVSMIDCIAFSINTCMTSVSGRLGSKLFHNMLDRFGFGHVTGIELEDEVPGELRPWRRWSKTDLATAAFGQGISSTPLQMITAFTPLANGGMLMKPMIVDSVVHPDGSVEHYDPIVVDQVITKQTSDTITAMLTAATRYGFAKKGEVAGYSMAGKTGTSQIARGGRGYESGTGSTIGTYVGYGPAANPRFIILVKFDRPIYRYTAFGESTAGPVFHDIASFILKYYGIPPDQVKTK